MSEWKDGRVAEGARLESVFTLTGNAGSNPAPSVKFPPCRWGIVKGENKDLPFYFSESASGG